MTPEHICNNCGYKGTDGYTCIPSGKVIVASSHTQSMEERFDEKFPPVSQWSQRSGDYTETPIPHIKAFIREELSSLKQRQIEELKDNKVLDSADFNEGIDVAIDIIKNTQ